MNIHTFRDDLKARMKSASVSQSELARSYGVTQSAISRFLSGNARLGGDAVLRLWPFVYGTMTPSEANHDAEARTKSANTWFRRSLDTGAILSGKEAAETGGAE